MEGATIGALLQEGAAELREAGVDAPDYEARVLLGHILDQKPNNVLLKSGQSASLETARIFSHLLALRAQRMPLQYVTRNTWFCGLQFRIDARALVPRMETEQLAEAVAERLAQLHPTEDEWLVDIGCGSGAIGLAIASLVPEPRVLLTDLSPEALALAAENVERLKLTERVTLAQGSYLEPVLRLGLADKVTCLVNNPPYVRVDEMPLLDTEVHAEPLLALQSPTPDGLGSYRELTQQLHLLPNLKLLGLEVGFEQAPAVVEMVKDRGMVEVLPDYAEIDRMVIVHVRR